MLIFDYSIFGEISTSTYLGQNHGTGIFLGLILGRISASYQFKNKQIFQMMFIIPNFLVLYFGENFMKIRTKSSKVTDV